MAKAKSDFKLVTKGGRTYIYLTRWNVCIGEIYSGVSPADAQKVIDSLTFDQPSRKRLDRTKAAP